MTASTVSGRSIGGVTYVETDKDYFAKRQLKRTAGAFGLWAIGISAVISGDFSGWNGASPKPDGVACWWPPSWCTSCTCLCSTPSAKWRRPCRTRVARIPSRVPPWSVGRLLHRPCGNHRVCDDRSTIVYFSSAYADAILSNLTGYSLDDHGLAWVWWLALYAIFVVVNWLGAETSFRFAEVVSIAALAIVALFGIGAFATGKADFSTLLNITPTEATPRSCRSARCHLLRHAVRHVVVPWY